MQHVQCVLLLLVLVVDSAPPVWNFTSYMLCVLAIEWYCILVVWTAVIQLQNWISYYQECHKNGRLE